MPIDTRVITGQKGAYQQQPMRYGRSESGRYSYFTWTGNRTHLLALVPMIEQAGGYWEMEESYTGVACKLSVRLPNDPQIQEAPEEQWEFFANEVEKEMLHGDVAVIDGLAQADKEAIRKWQTTGEAPTGLTGNALSAYKLMLTGMTATPVDAPVIRHTQIVSQVWQVKASLTNVRRIIATSALARLEGIPGTVLFELPLDTTSKAGFVYGWRKKFPVIRVAARQKVAIEQEWHYGLWPTLVYGEAMV